MGSSLTRLAAPAFLFVLGAGAMFAGLHGLWAKVVLAALLGVWTLAAIAMRSYRDARTPPAPRPAGQVEAQAREQRRLTAYLNLSPAPLLTLDGDRRLVAVNRAARRLFGCEDRVPDAPPELVEAIALAAPGRSASVRLDLGGEPRAFALATADLAAGGAGLRIAAVVDIDAELRAAEASALRDLLSVLSHEIMNALTPIASLGRTAAEMLAERPEPALDPARDAVETVARRAEGLQRFTTAYRDLARLPPPTLARVPVRPLLDDLARMFAARWPGLDLAREDAAALATIRADADQLHAALWALLQNAAEAVVGLENARVTLGCRAATEGVAFIVADTGPGVPTGEREAIFRPFHTAKPAGSGVGLALVRQIAHAHHGAVTLDDAAVGARFVMTLPAG
jgi:signal transduction histidine kinase